MFAPGLNGTITLSSGQLEISNTTALTTIAGPGATVLSISGNKKISVFAIDSGASVTISGVTIGNGSGAPEGGGILNSGTLRIVDSSLLGNVSDYGGAIFSTGTLAVEDCTFSGNSAAEGGGGVWGQGGVIAIDGSTFSKNSASEGGGAGNLGSTITFSDCLFAMNSASVDGGGISSGSQSSLTIQRCTFTSNSTQFDGSAIWNSAGTLAITTTIFSNNSGSAISNDQIGGAVTITDSTFTGNSTSRSGAAISNSSAVTVANCTFNGNSAQGGGAIANTLIWATPTITIVNSTISGNSAGGGGGGISNYRGTVVLKNSIVANNMSAAGTAYSDLAGGGPFGTYNLLYSIVGVAIGADVLISSDDGSLLGTTSSPIDPKLAPLGDYGGPTQTMPPLPGSPAIDAGSHALAVGADGKPLPTDQRGYYRIFNHTVDIGAVEYGSLPLLPGDANADGKVGFSDLVLVARNYGMTNASWADGDFNADGSVGFDDLVIVARNYGNSVSLTASTAVSESATITTLDTQPADELPRLGHVTRHRR